MTTTTTTATRWTPVGTAAFDALAGAIADAKRGDVLAPVTVVTPTAAAGLSLRRALARRHPQVGVSFHSFETLAAHIAAPCVDLDTVAVDRELIVAAVRGELREHPGRFSAIAAHRATWEAVSAAVLDVAEVAPAARQTLAAHGGLTAEIVRVHDGVADRVPLEGRRALFDAAGDRLVDSPAAAAAIGAVIVFAPIAAPTPVVDFVRAAARSVAISIIGGLVGDDDVDAATAAVVTSLGGAAPTEEELDRARGGVHAADQVLSANDLDDEISAAVRLILARAEGPSPVPLHRMAIVHPAGNPYASAVADVLRASGVAFSGPSVETLAHTAAGRVLRSLFAIAERDFAREAVIELWASGAVVGSDGALVPSVRFDDRTRRLGIVGGRSSWRDRLERRVERLEARRPPAAHEGLNDAAVSTSADASGADDWAAQDAARRARADADELAELADLDLAFSALEDWIDGIPTRWQDVAEWVDLVLDEACGPLTRRSAWPEWELDADLSVRAVFGALRALAAIEPEPGAALVVGTILAALDSPAPRRAPLGTGVTVTTLDDPPVSPHDVVVVVGMAEGHVPRIHREPVMVSDDARAEAGLETSADHTIAQRRALATALGIATEHAVATYARCDQRSGRTQVPSRWLVDGLEVATGVRPRTETLMAGHPAAGVDVIASHEAGVRSVLDSSAAALHREEFVRAHLAVADDLDAHPAAADGIVHAGATLIRSRRADAFTRFDGNLDGTGFDVTTGDRFLSPTALEQYAECPRKWFFRHGLGVGALDRPETVDQLQPRDKGTLAHRILERFIGEAIDAGAVPAPHEPWSSTDLQRLVVIAEEEFTDLERRGLVGHAMWWDDEKREIMHVLAETIRDDDRVRSAMRSTPLAVELTFGRDGVAPLEVTLDDGRAVRLAGQADRVDAVADGVMVHDYKYSAKGRYSSLAKPLDRGGDPVAGGTRMQLLAYAEAAAQQYGVGETSAWYWFLKPRDRGARIGYVITDAHRAMFRATLQTLVDGIGQGQYPARSGPTNWFTGTNEHCGFCDFRDVCPDDREDEWERVKHHPDLAPLRTLVEVGAPALVVDRPAAERSAAEHADTVAGRHGDPGLGTDTDTDTAVVGTVEEDLR